MKSAMLKRVLLFLFVIFSASSAFAETWVAGTNYKVLTYPVKTSNPSKIEVVEEFWFGCPHCYHLLDKLDAWEKKLPEDVNFVLSPAVFSGPWKLDAHMFYTLEALGIEKKMHHIVFDALVRDRINLSNEEDMANFFANYGVSKTKFRNAFNSFGVGVKLDQAAKRARAYRITGVPTLVVNGKYTVTVSEAGSEENLFKIVDYLIQKERMAKSIK